jgi:hypothetical protein
VLILSPASPARARCGASRLHEAGETRPVTPEQEQREGRDDESDGQSRVVNEDVIIVCDVADD